MEKILEARIHRLECLMKNEDMYDDYEDDSDDFDEFDEDASDEFDAIEPDEFNETINLNKDGVVDKESIKAFMSTLDSLADQIKQAGKYNKLFDDQFYKTGTCLRFIYQMMSRAGL